MKKRAEAVLIWEVGMSCIAVQGLCHWTDKLVEGMVQRSNNRQVREFHPFLSWTALNQLKYWSHISSMSVGGASYPKPSTKLNDMTGETPA